jgi:hypothetical protein
MTEERVTQRGSDHAGEGQRREGALLALLRRVVAPRPRVVLVMEPDGRLSCARFARSEERSLRSLG